MALFVFKLSDTDDFTVADAIEVNLNDSSKFHYNFWERSKKQLYSIPHCFKPEALDLLYISMMVFYADKYVNRSNEPDVWTRHLELYIPVIAFDKWNGDCGDMLKAALDFLTGDVWTLHFRERGYPTKREEHYKKAKEHFRKSVRPVSSDRFCMLSGGLDSFIGAINLLKDGCKPIFVGNYNGGKGVSVYQNIVIDALSNHFGLPKDYFFQFYATGVNVGEENTTRSRSLLFFSHAIALASGIDSQVELCIPENGVISLNIPLTVHRIGSLSTRTTHPYYIKMLQQIINGLGLQIHLYNPFQFMTKGEMMQNCKDVDFLKEWYVWTMSCSHPDLGRWHKEHGSSHCGVCLPCTIRRAAIMKFGVEDNSVYRDPTYANQEAKLNLMSYKLGLKNEKNPLSAIQESGPIREMKQEYADLYKRGLKELKDFLDSL
jgi:hypothetical protein